MSQSDSPDSAEATADENEATMYIEVAEINMEGWRSTIHSFEGVVHFSHHRGEDPKPVDRVTIDMVNGHEEIKGRGYGLDIASAEIE